MYGTRRSGLYPSDTLTLNVVAPFGSYCGVDTFTKIKSYKYQILAAENNLTQLIRNVEEAIISSKQNSDSASERIVASEKEVFASRKSLESAVILMQTGTQTFLDVIQAQNLKVNAQVRLTECITDYNIAQVQLLFESGIRTIDNVLNGINQNQGQTQNPQQNQQQNPSQNLPQNQSQNAPKIRVPFLMSTTFLRFLGWSTRKLSCADFLEIFLIAGASTVLAQNRCGFLSEMFCTMRISGIILKKR